MNSLLSNNILFQAFGAMMSGKSPQQFLSSLPQFKGMNLNNLEQTARDLCAKNGIDMNQKLEEIKSEFANSNR